MNSEQKARAIVDHALYDYIVIMQGIETANNFDYSAFNELLDDIRRTR
jgi:hypothetical protein